MELCYILYNHTWVVCLLSVVACMYRGNIGCCSVGDLEPTSGEGRRSHKLRIGRYAQHFVDALSFDVNPVEYLMNKFPEAGLKPEQMRAMLGKFGLSGHHHLTPICKLSGAQSQGACVWLGWKTHWG